MTETRKAIIELIQPYMDKSLSEGCLVKYQFNKFLEWIKKDNFWKITEVLEWKDSWLVYMVIWEDEVIELKNNPKKENKITKILWHYDITAVLKYLYRDSIETEIFWETIRIIHFHKRVTAFADPDFDSYFIPNKPLHLYTEQEEKDLLELLNKI